VELDINWLGEENIQKLFIEFPMPLALLNLDGGVKFVNKQFRQKFDIEELDNPIIRDRAHGPPKAAVQMSLNNLRGKPTPLLLHTILLTNFTLFVLDDTPGGAPDNELHEMRQRLAELERLSATDSLTGAWNRLPLERTADVEIKRALRYHHPISLLFFDIDHFKKINDTYGHAVGDDVLKEVIDIVRARIRESDTVYRWGGEEFVIMATATDHPSATILAENLRELIETHEFPEVGRVTISLGVAEYLPGDNLEIWLHRADKAVYAAKAKGRNQVVVDPFGASDIWFKDRDALPVQMVWHDHYNCGNHVIDEQHFDLFVQANRLIKLALDTEELEELEQQFDYTIEMIDRHFQDEEAVLRENGYPGLEQHKELHRQLLHKSLELRKEVYSGNIPVGHLLEYLAHDVVAKHILLADRQFFPFIEAKDMRKSA